MDWGVKIMVTLHDLCHCSINNPKLARNDHFTLMTISGHKTIPVFLRYSVITDDELQDGKWKNDVNSGVHMSVHQLRKTREIGWNTIMPIFFLKDLKQWWNFLITLWKMRLLEVSWEGLNGARNGNRTRDPELGKLVLYQLSYSRSKRFGKDFSVKQVTEKRQPLEPL